MSILPFRELNAKDANIAGGKGASLGEMTQAGIPVPPGFVILAATFDRFIKETELIADIESILGSVDHKEIHTVESASEKIQALIHGAVMPQDIEEDISDHFKKLGCEFVAVRSSATSEDSADAAWAGQLDSYLNTTEAKLLENVKKCWASLFTPRAIFYRFEKGLHVQQISVAVVVQKMVESEISGIAFSVHPVTQDYNQLIIEAGLGLGEAIVSGAITPDSYVVEKSSLRIIDKNISAQERAMVRGSQGGSVWEDTDKTKGQEQALSDEQILELATIILRIEKHYGFPCDIEWAWEAGVFYIVQSRPITTLHNEEPVAVQPHNGEQGSARMKWHTLLARNGVDLTTISGLDLVFAECIREYAGRDDELFFTRFDKASFTHYIGVDSQELGRYLYEKYFKNAGDIVHYYERGLELLGEIVATAQTWHNKGDNRSLRDAFRGFCTQFAEINHIYSITSWLAIEAWQADFDMVLNTLIARNGLEHDRERITRSAYLPWKKTALPEISDKLAQGEAPDQLLEEYQFLRTWAVVWYKPLGLPWIESLRPERKDDQLPTYSLQELQNLLQPTQEEAAFLELAPYIVFFKDWRDDVRRTHAFRWSFLFDAIAAHLGLSRDEVGYLTLDEIEQALQEPGTFAQLASGRAQETCIIVPGQNATVAVWCKDIPDQYTALMAQVETQSSAEVIRGLVAQKGTAIGIARIVRSFHDLKRVEEGNILVANTTHPDYLLAMKKAAAFVTNEGGTISHAAIVARELYKPCIVGTKVATRLIKDGDTVEVDADKGEVRIVSSAVDALVKKLSSMTWHYVHKRRRTPFFTHLIWEGTGVHHDSAIGFSYELKNFLYLDSEIAIGQKEWDALREKLNAELVQNPRFLINLLEGNYLLNDRIEALCKELRSLDYDNIDRAELARRFNEYIDLTYKFGACLALPLYIEEDMELALQERCLKVFGEEKATEVFQILTTPIKPGAAQQEEEAILKLAMEKAQGQLTEEDIENYLEQFSWTKNNSFTGVFTSRHEVEERIARVLSGDPARQYADYGAKMGNVRNRIAEYRDHFKDDPDTVARIDTLQESIYFRSWRTERYYRNAYFLQPFFRKIAEALGLQEEGDLFYLIPPEISDLLEGVRKADTELIAERKNGYMVLTDTQGAEIFSGSIIEAAKDAISFFEAQDHKEIKGQVAYPGYAKGRARVIVEKADLGKVAQGDILIATSTTVDYVSSLKKVAAIVTEEGGVLSHASVISRELHVPCIIGTKIATQAIHDGDLVEVDAYQGIVKILTNDRNQEVDGYTLERVIERLKTQTQWYNKSYSGFLFGIAQQGMAIAYGEDASHYAIPFGVLFQNHNRAEHWDWFWDSELLAAKRAMILDKVKEDSAFVSQFYETWKKEWDAYLAEWERLAHRNVAGLSLDEIRKPLIALHDQYVRHGSLAYVVDAFLNDSTTDWLEEEIKLGLGDKATAEVIAALTAPAYESFVNEFEMGKLTIAQALTKGEEIASSCAALAHEFFWIRANYQSYQRITAEAIHQEVAEEAAKYGAAIAKRIKEEENRVSESRKKKAVLIKKLGVSDKLRRVIEVSEIFTHIQDKRKEGVLRTNVIFFEALASVGQKLGIEARHMLYLTPSEFLDPERFKKVDWQVIKDREKKGALLLFCNKDCYVLPRAQYEKEIPLEYFFNSIQAVDEIKGSVAYKGVVRGIAKVVHNISEIQKFNEGEVLVANQTTPEYVPAMKKAIAFVTDQGGITCHAAIVAREMKRPCIIGTKIATKVIKDGDMVEVDANQGLVRVIEQGTQNESSYLKSVDWTLYLEREQPLSLFASFVRPYGSRLKQVTGFGFVNQLHYFQEKTGRFYRSAIEMKDADEYYLSLIKQNDPRISKWQNLGIQHNAIADELLERFSNQNISLQERVESYPLIQGQCEEIMLYGTVIPYRILSAVNYAIEGGENKEDFEWVIKLFEPLRATTRYPALFEKVIPVFWEAAAELTKVKDSKVFSLFDPDELGDILNSPQNFDYEHIEKRKNGCAFWIDFQEKISFDVSPEILQNLNIGIDSQDNVFEIRGAIGNPGIVRGKARIINNLKEINDFEEGDIIVSINTSPSLMPILIKSGGIVTDEGGIMCHAAIVSRELSKPCVIGTKLATKVIHDGDTIEVDADRGLVTILKRKEEQVVGDWKKNWSGKWTLLECCYFGKEYTKLLKDHYEVGPSHSLFTFDEGVSANFLVSQEIEAFAKNLVEKVHQNEMVAEEWASAIIKRADEVLKFVREKRPKIDYEDFVRLWKILDAYLLAHFPIKKVVDYLPEKTMQKILPLLEKARVYAEPVYAESLEFVQQFAKSQSSQFGLSPESFLCLTDSELKEAFVNNNVPPNSILEERYRHSMLRVNDGTVEIFVGTEAQELAKATIHRAEDKKILKGTTAFPGKVTGTVRIVFHPSEVSELVSGTVLVTGMTRPDYLHLFKDALAVVTDAGGMLSHAAITARELKKPTVVGTEHATKVLHDGDLVEVDAEHGIVTIIRSQES